MGYIENKKNVIKFHVSTTFAIVGFCIFSFLLLPLYQAFLKDSLVGIQFLLIGFISISALFLENEKRSFSLSMSVYFFCYLFFYCAALFQFSYDTFRWFLYPTVEEVIVANNLILVGLVSFIFGHKFYLKTNHSKNIKEKNKIRRWVIYISLLFLTSYFVYLLTIMPISDFFSRATFQSNDFDNQSTGLVISSIRNGIALICSLILIKCYQEKHNLFNFLLMLYSLILALFIIPPTGVARFLSGAFYGALLLYSFPVLRQGKIFLLLMFSFILIIFPLLNNFRYLNGNALEIFDVLDGLSNNFQAADFDAYTMLIYTIKYTSNFGYSFGRQLLGTLLFFIPRAAWPSKPIGSGSMIVDTLFIPINGNVSCPFIAEYFINFGILGVVIISLLLGCLLNTIDKVYWEKKKYNGFLQLFYPFLSLITIFCCRGDMMSSTSFLIGTFISAYIEYRMIVKRVDYE